MSKINITYIKNNITAPIGFKSAGIAAGIKGLHALDLGLIYSQVPAIAAGVFTQNKICAAPLILTKKNLTKAKMMQAIIVNSGNANSCTGKMGALHAKQMSTEVAANLNINTDLIGVSSTGIIGKIMLVVRICLVLVVLSGIKKIFLKCGVLEFKGL